MLQWRFSVTHVPGKKYRILDALSRYPWAELAALAALGAEFPTEEEILEAEELEGAVVASVSGVVLSWEQICELSGEDDEIRKVISLLGAGVEDREQWLSMSSWFALRGGLVVVDTALLLKGRVVVPAAGRSATLA